ncbi:DUF2158 domain-containing protein [Aliarcobacter cryaerophilus]|uniref:YodC family protein n=1 Tax=Aliarcobacter cryaerophilus TaxID=28198 RepID=UPI003DA483BA
MFNVGDTVQLKSGGPVMTISSVEDDEIECCWFDDVNSKTANYQSFSPSMLKSTTVES